MTRTAEAHWRGSADLWIFSAGLGYRFNLGSIFGHSAEAAPIK